MLFAKSDHDYGHWESVDKVSLSRLATLLRQAVKYGSMTAKLVEDLDSLQRELKDPEIKRASKDVEDARKNYEDAIEHLREVSDGK